MIIKAYPDRSPTTRNYLTAKAISVKTHMHVADSSLTKRL